MRAAFYPIDLVAIDRHSAQPRALCRNNLR